MKSNSTHLLPHNFTNTHWGRLINKYKCSNPSTVQVSVITCGFFDFNIKMVDYKGKIWISILYEDKFLPCRIVINQYVTYLPAFYYSVPIGHLQLVKATASNFPLFKLKNKQIVYCVVQLLCEEVYEYFIFFNKIKKLTPLDASVYHSQSTCEYQIFTNGSMIQFYTGYSLNQQMEGNSTPHGCHSVGGVETDLYSNSANPIQTATMVLEQGKFYESQTMFKFSSS